MVKKKWYVSVLDKKKSFDRKYSLWQEQLGDIIKRIRVLNSW
jgi:hypothetical protein